MRATAILRCHNNEATIVRAIESLLAQDLGVELDIVAVDDASTDGSWPRIERYRPRVRAFRLDSNRGNIEAAYFGLEQAKGRCFLLLDADDYAEPEFARILVEALERIPRSAAAYCDYFEEDETGRRKIIRIDNRLIRMVACNVAFDREAVLRTGFWDRELLLPEYDLLVRLLKDHEAVYVDRPLYHYCRHSASMTRQGGFFDLAIQQLAQRYAQRLGPGRFEKARITDFGGTLTWHGS